jgi:putative endonuclease
LKHKNGEGWTRNEIGEYGERIASDYLRTKGVKILRQNFSAAHGGEVDIVARKGKLLLFIEVKTRRSGGIGRPLDAVNKAKQVLIERGANEWLKLLGTRKIPWRFDVIEVILEENKKPTVNWVENAF